MMSIFMGIGIHEQLECINASIILDIYEGIMGGCAILYIFLRTHGGDIAGGVRVSRLESIRVRDRVVMNENLGVTDVKVSRVREIYLMGVSSDCVLR